MPEVDAFIVNAFHQIGMVSSGSMSLAAITFAELDHFCNRMCVDLTPWESMQVINMSREYCYWLNKSKDPMCVSPWNDNDPDAIAENDAIISAKMKSLRNKNKSC